MSTWDVFHSDRLEVERGLSAEAVREALARGDLRDDDLIRPAGSTDPWTQVVDMAPLVEGPPPATTGPAFEPESEPEPEPGPAAGFKLLPIDIAAEGPGDEPFGGDDIDAGDDQAPMAIIDEDEDDDEIEFEGEGREPLGGDDLRPGHLGGDEEHTTTRSSLELVAWDDEDAEVEVEEFDPQEEDEAAAEFTLARGSAETVEELDLAAMVDVAFQLVLFFLVTATTVLYKSLEVPRPNPENNPAAAAQGSAHSLDDLKETYILVEIDPSGAVKVDNEPVAADVAALAERLRSLRERTRRKAMLLTADFATPHRSAVLAYDAANEIGLGIAIARPKAPPTR